MNLWLELPALAKLPPWLLAMGLGLLTLLLEDLALALASACSAHQCLPTEWAFVAVSLGIVLGDLGLYGLGRWGQGHRALQARSWACSRWAMHLKRHPGWVVVGARLMPGTRTLCYVLCGVVQVPAGRFACWVLFSTLAWTAGLFWLGERVMATLPGSGGLWLLGGMTVWLGLGLRRQFALRPKVTA